MTPLAPGCVEGRCGVRPPGGAACGAEATGSTEVRVPFGGPGGSVRVPMCARHLELSVPPLVGVFQLLKPAPNVMGATAAAWADQYLKARYPTGGWNVADEHGRSRPVHGSGEQLADGLVDGLAVGLDNALPSGASLDDPLVLRRLLARLREIARESDGGSMGPDPQPPEPTARAETAYMLLRDAGVWDVVHAPPYTDEPT